MSWHGDTSHGLASHGLTNRVERVLCVSWRSRTRYSTISLRILHHADEKRKGGAFNL
jgi:hypothetical protein